MRQDVPKGLLAAVIVMGVLIVLGTAGLIGTVGWRMAHPRTQISARRIPGGETMRASLPLPSGWQLGTPVARPDGSVIVPLSGPGGRRLVLWRPETGRIEAEFSLPDAP